MVRETPSKCEILAARVERRTDSGIRSKKVRAYPGDYFV